jgi:hypothetical protein
LIILNTSLVFFVFGGALNELHAASVARLIPVHLPYILYKTPASPFNIILHSLLLLLAGKIIF